MKSLLISAMALSVAVTVSAADTIWFPTAGGDLATGWGSPAPTSVDRAYLNLSGRYTASADLAFGAIWFVGANSLIDFSATPDRKVDLSGYSIGYYEDHGLNMEQVHYNKAFVTGGTWDFHDTSLYAGPVSMWYGGFEATNAVFTNVKTLYFGEHTKGNVVRLNNTELSCQSILAYASCDHNDLWIENGSKVAVSGTLATDGAGSADAGNGCNRIIVSGSGSSLEANGDYTFIGQTHQGNAIIVTNGACFAAPNELRIGEFDSVYKSVSSNALVFADHATGTVNRLYVGRYPGNDDCRLEVLDGSMLTVKRLWMDGGSKEHLIVSGSTLEVTDETYDVYLGYNANSFSNEISVADGATVRFSNGGYRTFFGYGENSSFGRFTAKDSTLYLNHFKIGVGDHASSNVFEAVGGDVHVEYIHFGNPSIADAARTGTGNRFSAVGGKFSITCTYEDPFGYCSGNEVEIGGLETTWNYAGFNLARYGTNNVFRLCGGATMDITGGSLCVGDQGGASNVLMVTSGATVKADRLRLYRNGNSLVVSNGVVSVPSGLATSYNYYDHDAACRVRLEGASTAVAASDGEVYIHADCTLEFAPAAEGLSAIPLTAKTLNIAGGPTLKIEIPEGLQGDENGIVVLAKATGSLSVQDATLEAARESLPKGWKLKCADNTLYLKKGLGLSVIVR